MNIDKVREALDVWDRFQNATDVRPGREQAAEATQSLVEVARQVLNGEEVWWCKKHHLLGTDMECDKNGMGHRACAMVPARLLIGDTE